MTGIMVGESRMINTPYNSWIFQKGAIMSELTKVKIMLGATVVLAIVGIVLWCYSFYLDGYVHGMMNVMGM